MGLFVSKKEKEAIEKIRQDEESRKYAVTKNLNIVVMAIVVLSYSIPTLINAISNNLPNVDKMMSILWSLLSVAVVIESVINLTKLKKYLNF